MGDDARLRDDPGSGAQDGGAQRAVDDPRPGQRPHVARAFDGGHLTLGGQRCGQIGAAIARKAIRQPERVEAFIRQGIGQPRHGRLIRLPRFRVQGGQPRGQRIGGHEDRPIRRQIGQRDQRDGAPGAARLGQRLGDAAGPRRPVARIGPASVGQDQKRPLPGRFLFGVQDRPGEAKDQRRDRQHADQQQPPGGAVGLNVLIRQTQQQRDTGKAPPDRRRWHGAQQKPQHRQQDKTPEKPGQREADGAQNQHQRGVPSAP